MVEPVIVVVRLALSTARSTTSCPNSAYNASTRVSTTTAVAEAVAVDVPPPAVDKVARWGCKKRGTNGASGCECEGPTVDIPRAAAAAARGDVACNTTAPPRTVVVSSVSVRVAVASRATPSSNLRFLVLRPEVAGTAVAVDEEAPEAGADESRLTTRA